MKLRQLCCCLLFIPLSLAACHSIVEPAPPVSEAGFPPLPQTEHLISYRVGVLPADRFQVDSDSLGVFKGGETRYVLVMRGGDGEITSITWEGLRCNAGQRTIYAIVEAGRWHLVPDAEWTSLDGHSGGIARFDYHGSDPRTELASHYLCQGSAPRLKRDILGRLRGGGVDFSGSWDDKR